MTDQLSVETIEYIKDQYVSGRWEHTPGYLGMYNIFPNGEKQPFAVHKSLTQAGMIAFYESVEKAEARRETIMKVGKFLTKYRAEVFTQDEIRALAERYQAEAKEEGHELKFATTQSEIEDVYVSGPSSCMHYEADHYDSDMHPTRVYAAGDLAVAHIGTNSRALCWPAKKIYGSVYGNTEAPRDNLKAALKDQGYEYAPKKFHGAKLLKIKQYDSYVMPYLDNDFHVVDRGDHMTMDIWDGILAKTQTGLLTETSVCTNCEESYNPEDSEDIGLCDYCYNNTSTCDSCENRFNHNNDGHWVESSNMCLCDYCFNELYEPCDDCGEPTQRDKLEEVDDKHFCAECLYKNATQCETCDGLVLETKTYVTTCHKIYCNPSCMAERHDPDCRDCESAPDSMPPGDTSENLESDLNYEELEIA